jgi:plastocyanin
MRKLVWITALAGAFALAACGGGGGGGDTGGNATCSPSGTEVKVVAQNFAFDKDCYAAPANTAFKVDLDNKDTAPHTFSIYTDSSAGTDLFVSDQITAEDKVFDVKGLDAGTYYFQCDVHTSMNGTFVVK